jgi:hypothetical protein
LVVEWELVEADAHGLLSAAMKIKAAVGLIAVEDA